MAGDAGDLRELVDQAEAGDSAALVQLRDRLNGDVRLRRRMDALLPSAISQLVELGAGGDELGKDVLAGRVLELQASLTEGYDSRVAKVLVDAVCLAWVDLEISERALTLLTGKDHDRASGRYWSQRVSAAQGRYLRALKMLAEVRKLDLGRVLEAVPSRMKRL